MEKRLFNYNSCIAALFVPCTVMSLLSCSRRNSDKPTIVNSGQNREVANSKPEENQLVDLLIEEKIVDELKGFVVEKKQHDLFINGQQQPREISDKYLSQIKKEVMRVEVHPFLQRMMEHPDSGFIQIAAPVEFSSPCVVSSSKPGC